jgi:Vitamin-D-receptor interacting Mediator subunit 4
MGSLSMEEPPSMAEQVLRPLVSLEASFNALLTSLTTTPSYSAAPSAAQSLLTADDSLTTALQALYTHQQNYAHILQLRAEALRLEDQIKITIRTCLDLRKEIGNIHPSILPHPDDSSNADDTDSEDDQKDVDYTTLLSFASKIGKHNAAAAKEAEEESIRRLIQARKEKENTATTTATQPRINGNTSTSTTNPETGEPASQTLIPQYERDWLDAESAMARARSGMAFPAAENLRRGTLGKLQLVREQGGEEAVERELERMVAESEGRELKNDGDEVVAAPTLDFESPQTALRVSGLPSSSQQQQQQQGQGQGQGSRPPPPPPLPQQQEKKKSVALDLDLWNEDDEDDD